MSNARLSNASFKFTFYKCVVSVCCVGFGSPYVDCDELHDCVWNVVLISVCMFIVSKALLISNATVFVRAGANIWLNRFATVLFNVCSASLWTVVFCTCVAWVCLVCLLLCKEDGSSLSYCLLDLSCGEWNVISLYFLCCSVNGSV